MSPNGFIPFDNVAQPEEFLPVYAVGIDIGGTKIAGAVVDDEGNIVAHVAKPSPASDVQAMEDTVVAIINELSTPTSPRSITRPTSPGETSLCERNSRNASPCPSSWRTTLMPQGGRNTDSVPGEM
jgi:predicted NBD/HSP70 family sugar kinase